MRLKEEHIEIIKRVTKDHFGENAKVYLFGSRADDNKKGGDIDLYIETGIKENILERKLKMLVDLEKLLGEQKIDVVINNFLSEKPIYFIAKHGGMIL